MAGQKVVQDERPFLSVLVPSYYSDKTLPETLNSILEQTFHNWQLIVCGDVRTANSRAAAGGLYRENYRTSSKCGDSP